MKTALLLVLIAVLVYAYDPVFVNELRDLVKDKGDKKLLKVLRHNAYMIRSTKEAKVNEILKKQDEATQKLYAETVQAKKLKRKAKIDKRISKAGEKDQAVKDYLEQAEKIINDMTISDDDARKKLKELKAKLNKKQRKLLIKLKKFT
ncbi:unnamed protein product [Cylicocyclus nassatus]|uniref:SXP/RAL-2 family protein Ani s 5-like cation-binding domain-containing protein n=1 Tax=Cylicocyclus nassatus TaxID=53992 RepID=A0AA36HDX6_CYLNA|nr:unnamed protein product [Cylicocyclus nassatus]